MLFLKEDTLHPKFKKEIGRDYKRLSGDVKQFEEIVDILQKLARKDTRNLLKLKGMNRPAISRLVMSVSRDDFRARLARFFKEHQNDSEAKDLAMEVFFNLKDVYRGKDFKARKTPGVERANKAFYVVHYDEQPAYEPAEGGYYYATRDAVSSKGFDTEEEAWAYAEESAKELRDYDGLEMVKIEHGYLFPSKYIGEEQYIMVEPNKDYLSMKKGKQIYESIEKKELVSKIRELLEGEGIYADVYQGSDSDVEVYISDGDWKHEHLRVELLVKRFARDNNMEVEHTQENAYRDEDDISDTFSATHYFTFKEMED